MTPWPKPQTAGVRLVNRDESDMLTSRSNDEKDWDDTDLPAFSPYVVAPPDNNAITKNGVDSVYNDLGDVRWNGHIREETSRTGLSVSQDDETLDEPLKPKRDMYRGEAKHKDSDSHNALGDSRCPSLEFGDDQV